jgi:Acylamino-acid-releasing enzyme, N-terminal domain
VAYKKESKEKLVESSKYFGYRSSEDDVNKFEYVDDWGEKYVGLVSLSLNVLNTVTGEISTVGGIDDAMWTVGQPVFLPDIESDTQMTTDSPSYRLAYTAWKNGPKKLGMIYCYQRESSIFVVDLSNLLNTEKRASMDATSDLTRSVPKDATGTETHVLVTSGIKLARSARVSTDGMRMIFLGSKKGFATHNGCSELLSVQVPDIIRSLAEATTREEERKDDSTGNEKKDERLSYEIQINTIVPTISCPGTTETSSSFGTFPGIYADQLPRNCFLNDDCVVMSTPWGSVESIIAIHLSSGKIEKINIPLENVSVENRSKISSSILDIKKVEQKNTKISQNEILVTISTPSSTQTVALLNLEMEEGSDPGSSSIAINLITPPSNYVPNQKPITRLKPAKKTTQEDPKADLKKKDNVKTYRKIDIKQKLDGDINFNKLLDWKTTRYYDADGIPFESILITPKMTEKGVYGFEDLGPSRKCPLIVVPHGGPHSCMTTTYVASYAFLALYLGAAVLHVNFRGSTGFGQKSIDALLGTIR